MEIISEAAFKIFILQRLLVLPNYQVTTVFGCDSFRFYKLGRRELAMPGVGAEINKFRVFQEVMLMI